MPIRGGLGSSDKNHPQYRIRGPSGRSFKRNGKPPCLQPGSLTKRRDVSIMSVAGCARKPSAHKKSEPQSLTRLFVIWNETEFRVNALPTRSVGARSQTGSQPALWRHGQAAA